MKDSALIIIDMQNDFVKPDGALYVPSYPEEIKAIENSVGNIIDGILKYSERFEKNNIFFTQDIHPKGHIEETIFPPHCIKGTAGAKIIDELKPLFQKLPIFNTIMKGDNKDIFSYSISTGFMFPYVISYLRNNNITNIYLVGVAYDYCVGESAIDFSNQGFNVIIIKNLTKSVNEVSARIMNKKILHTNISLSNV